MTYIDTYLVFVKYANNIPKHGARVWISLVVVDALNKYKNTVPLLIVHLSSHRAPPQIPPEYFPIIMCKITLETFIYAMQLSSNASAAVGCLHNIIRLLRKCIACHPEKSLLNLNGCFLLPPRS